MGKDTDAQRGGLFLHGGRSWGKEEDKKEERRETEQKQTRSTSWVCAMTTQGAGEG